MNAFQVSLTHMPKGQTQEHFQCESYSGNRELCQGLVPAPGLQVQFRNNGQQMTLFGDQFINQLAVGRPPDHGIVFVYTAHP